MAVPGPQPGRDGCLHPDSVCGYGGALLQAGGWGRFVGLANFRLVLESRAFLLAALNTLRFILVCIPALMAFSLCTAVMIQSCSGHASPSGRGGNVYKTSILLPMAIPVASVVLLWKLLFYPQGLLGQLAGLVGLAGQDWLNQPSAFGILVVTYIWKNTGYDMMLWLAGLNAIPRNFMKRPGWTK